MMPPALSNIYAHNRIPHLLFWSRIQNNGVGLEASAGNFGHLSVLWFSKKMITNILHSKPAVIMVHFYSSKVPTYSRPTAQHYSLPFEYRLKIIRRSILKYPVTYLSCTVELLKLKIPMQLALDMHLLSQFQVSQGQSLARAGLSTFTHERSCRVRSCKPGDLLWRW